MALDRRIENLEEQKSSASRYIAVVDGEETPETVEAFLPGGYDRQRMAADDPRLKTIIHVVRTEEWRR
jgi:hypothetical protein